MHFIWLLQQSGHFILYFSVGMSTSRKRNMPQEEEDLVIQPKKLQEVSRFKPNNEKIDKVKKVM